MSITGTATMERTRGSAAVVMIDAADVHPGWWPCALDGIDRDPQLLDWLLSGRRTRARLFGSLVDATGLSPRPAPSGSTLGRLIALDEKAFGRVLCRIGLVWNRALLAREIDHSTLHRIIGQVGEESLRRALSEGAPAGRIPADGETGGIDPDMLAADGNFCLRHWIAAHTARGADQLCLRLPPLAARRPRLSVDEAARARHIVDCEVMADG